MSSTDDRFGTYKIILRIERFGKEGTFLEEQKGVTLIMLSPGNSCANNKNAVCTYKPLRKVISSSWIW